MCSCMTSERSHVNLPAANGKMATETTDQTDVHYRRLKMLCEMGTTNLLEGYLKQDKSS